MKRKLFSSERIVPVLATFFTCVWIFCLFFPIYWLVITSFKDTTDAFSDPPSFAPTTSDDYNIIVDYEREVWEGLSEKEFESDMNVLLWSNFREFQANKIGQLKVFCRVDNEIVGSAVLQKSSYTLNRSRIWDTAGSLVPEDIIFRLEAIDEYEAVKYNTLKELPEEKKWSTNEVTKDMLSLSTGYADFIHGNVTETFWHNNWKNFLQNYIAAWEYPIAQGIEGGLLQAMKNSLILSVSIVLGEWIVCGLAGYSLSKLFENRIGRKILLVFLATSMIPTTVTIAASYLCLQRIGLASNMLGIIIPMTCNASNILLFKSNFDGISDDIVNAARIDGAGEMAIFTRVMMPLSKPIFATIGLLTFGSGWGEFFWSNIILRERSQFTVPMVLKILYGTSGASVNYPMLMAMSLIISIPTIFIMIFGQKDLSQGMNFSGLKG